MCSYASQWEETFFFNQSELKQSNLYVSRDWHRLRVFPRLALSSDWMTALCTQICVSSDWSVSLVRLDVVRMWLVRMTPLENWTQFLTCILRFRDVIETSFNVNENKWNLLLYLQLIWV